MHTGEGDDWLSPMYGLDFPEYPFLPTSWAGADAGNQTQSANGANITLTDGACGSACVSMGVDEVVSL